jgi:hypothetical protein
VVKEKAIRRGECIQSRDYEMFHLDAFLQLGKFRALVTTNGIRAWAFSSDSGYLLRNLPAVTLDQKKVEDDQTKSRVSGAESDCLICAYHAEKEALWIELPSHPLKNDVLRIPNSFTVIVTRRFLLPF